MLRSQGQLAGVSSFFPPHRLQGSRIKLRSDLVPSAFTCGALLLAQENRLCSPTNQERLLFNENGSHPCLAFCSLKKMPLKMVTYGCVSHIALVALVSGILCFDSWACPASNCWRARTLVPSLAPRLSVMCGCVPFLSSLTPSTLAFRITSLSQMPMMCWPALAAELMF